jgi:creatinine amidohydrolase/Fe(II)-dependent formamide hydrolase-like protein
MLELLGEQGFRLIVVLNGHGGDNHMATISRLCDEFTEIGPASVVTFNAWDAREHPSTGVAHAGSEETSRLMLFSPGAVDLSTLPPIGEPLYNRDWGIVDGPTWAGNPTPDRTTRDDPRVSASPEHGEISVESSVSHISDQVAELQGEMGWTPHQP